MIEKLNDEYAISFVSTRLAMMLALLIVMAHWLACAWYVAVSIEGEDSSENWVLSYFGTNDVELWDIYLVCIYWAIMTMTTIG